MKKIISLTSQDIAVVRSFLNRLLLDAAAENAMVGVGAPFSPQDATRIWTAIAREVATGRREVLAAIDQEDRIIGTLHLVPDMALDGPHRGRLEMLIVSPCFRRQGIGRALISAAEAAARERHLTLILANAREGDPAALLVTAAGYHTIGTVEDYARCPDGGMTATIFFFKRL